MSKVELSGIGKQALTFFSIATIVCGVVWKAYAEDKIDSQIKTQIKPIISQVEKNTKKLKDIDYQTKQTLFLIKKMVGKKAVREMEEETEIFKPKD